MKALFCPPVVLLPCFSMMFCHVAVAQAPGGSIAGQVQVAFGNFPSELVLITLIARGAPVSSMYADNEGHFTFGNLPGNVYHIVINEKDYQPVDETVVIDPTTPVRYLSIRLSPRRHEASGAHAGVVSGGNPYVTNVTRYSKLFPTPALKEFEAGVKADRRNKPDEAVKHYEKAIQIAPDFYPARNNLGITFLNRKRYQEAQEEFQEVIRINPSDAAAYFNLGNLYLLTHRDQEAMHWVQQGLDEEPDSAFGQFLKGSLYLQRGNAQQAESALRRSLQLDATMARAHLALVNLYLQQTRKNDAIVELRSFLKLFPKDPLSPQARKVLDRLQRGKGAGPQSK